MTDHVLPADQQVRTRLASDLDRNFLVEAGAGSGKTHSLAERMASGVAQGRYQVANMVAVTFTRKAAAELRGRFQLALEARLAAGPPAHERACLDAALGGIERFFAGTIHAFCARLLRERPVEAGVAPGFVELDEVEDEVARLRAWRDFLARESARGSALLTGLRGVGLRPADLDHAFALVCDHADVDFPPGDAVAPDGAAAWRALEACWKEIAQHVPDSIDPATTCGVQKIARSFSGRLELARRDRLPDLAGLIEPWEGIKVIKKWWGSGESKRNALADRMADLVTAFQRETVDPFLEQWRAWVYRQAISVLMHGREFYAEERRRQNLVNYVDLLMMTATLLREHVTVRRALQRKFRWLFIDEFQDTDPIQAEVFMLLGAEEADEGVSLDWTSLPLRPGALFVVGDPKQSIYRFRRADIDIYSHVRERIVACGGEVLRLTANFRSRPAVCDFANRVFHTRFPATATPEAPAFERLQPVRPDDPAGRPSVVAHLLPAGTPQKATPAVEAESIAAWIMREVRGGSRTFGDFLVLTRNRPRLKVYAQTFEEAGIPVEVSGAGSFGGSPEVEALRQLLGALADPLDTAALVGVLRGPLFGLSDVDLFRFRQAGGRFDLSLPPGRADGAPPADDIAAPSEAMTLLNRLFRRARRLPLGAALEHILEETGMLALAAATPAGAGAGDLLQALDRVRQVAERGGGWADAVHMLSEEAVEASDVEALPLEPGRRDVVRLMNLHKAKGLEADVVFLADPCHGSRFEPEIRILRGGSGATGWLRIARKLEDRFGDVLLAQPLDWPAHCAAEGRYLDAEQDRLLYVAATRARELLVIGRSATSRENRAWGAFDPFVSDVVEHPLESKQTSVDVASPAGQLPEDGRAQAAVERDSRQRRAVRPSWSVTSVSDEVHLIARSRRIRKSAGDALGPGHETLGDGMADPTMSVLPESPSHRGDAGAAWGALVHGLLEYATHHPEATDESFRRLGRWLLIDDPDLRPFIADAIACVEAVRHAPFWDRVRQSDVCYVEVPFIQRMETSPAAGPAPGSGSGPAPPTEAGPRGGRPKRTAPSPVQITLFDQLDASHTQGAAAAPDATTCTLLRGVIDLVCLDGGAWCIVDYKTDQILVDVSELAARYGDQVNRYVLAWQDVQKQRVLRAELFHTRTLRTVAIPRDST